MNKKTPFKDFFLRLVKKVFGINSDFILTESFFEKVLNFSKDVFLIYSPDLKKIVYSNPSYEKVWGVSSLELKKDPFKWMNYVHEKDREMVRFFFPEKITFPMNIEFPDFRIVLPSKSISWISANVYSVSVEVDEKPFLIIRASDITMEKTAEKTLLESEKTFRAMIENIQDVLYRSDADGNLVFVSPSVRKILGYRSGMDLIGKNIAETMYYNSDDRSNFLKALMENGEVVDYEAILRRADGSPVQVSTSSHLYHDEDGNFAGVEGVVKDITARKTADEIFNKAFMENPCAMSISLIENGLYVEVNRTWMEILGHKREEAIGHTPFELGIYRNQADREKIVDSIRKTGSAHNIEIEFVSKSGKSYFGIYFGEVIEAAGKRMLLSSVLNVTSQRAAESALAKSEERFRRIAENAPDVIYRMLVPSGIYEYVSPSSLKLLGYTPDEIYSRPGLISEAIHPSWREYFSEMWNRLLNGDVPESYEYQVVTKDGEVRWLHQRNILLCGPDGTPEAIEGIITNITDRKISEVLMNKTIEELEAVNEELMATNEEFEAANEELMDTNSELEKTERSLRESKEKYRSLIENLSAGMIVYDNDNRIVVSNPAASEILGITGDMMTGASLFNHGWNAIKEDGSPVVDMDYPIVYTRVTGKKVRNRVIGVFEKHSGNVLWLLCDSYPLFDDEGHVIQTVGTFIDITDRKAAELEVRTLKDRLSNIIDSYPDMLIGLDRVMKVTLINKKTETVMGISREEAVGRPAISVLKEFAPSVVSMMEGASSDRYVSMHGIQTEVNGEKRHYNLKLFPLQEEGAVLRIEDISDLMKKEEQLRQAQKMETVGTLAGGFAHDFNNVLSGIVGTASLMRYLLESNPNAFDKILEHVEIIEQSSRRATEMVQQLLMLSRKYEIKMVLLDLNESLKNVVKICKNTFDKSVYIITEYSPVPAYVEADPPQIEQVILNLCINASHAMTIMRKKDEKQGGTLILNVRRVVADRYFCSVHPEAKAGAYWMIGHVDNGVGMDDDTMHKIFDPFFTTKERDQGTGLGLSMVYSIINQHGGFIDVYSELGIGSTFNVYLPEIKGSGVIRDEERKAAVIKGEGLVLVIDDEEIVRSIAENMLMECGYRVLSAASGREGLMLYEEEKKNIKAVLLDMAMPGMSGKEVFIELKKTNPEVKVLMASGFRQDGRVQEVLSLGIKGFLQKPYSISELSKMLKEII